MVGPIGRTKEPHAELPPRPDINPKGGAAAGSNKEPAKGVAAHVPRIVCAEGGGAEDGAAVASPGGLKAHIGKGAAWLIAGAAAGAGTATLPAPGWAPSKTTCDCASTLRMVEPTRQRRSCMGDCLAWASKAAPDCSAIPG